MGGVALTRLPPNERPTAQQLTAGGERLQIAGKPADKCPYCGAVMFVDGVNRTEREIVRYVVCRNRLCGRRFLTKQPPAKIMREVGQDDDSANGKPALTVARYSA